MKGTKKVLSFILSFLMILDFAVTSHVSAFAASNNQVSYENILDSLNRQYDLNLGYVSVDTSKVSLIDYEKNVSQFAKQQRRLLNYIAYRKAQKNSEASDIKTKAMLTSTTKTVTKWCDGYDGSVYITATYTVTGNKVSYPSSCNLDISEVAFSNNQYISDLSSPSYSKLDSGRTLAIKYTGLYHWNIITVTNATFYAEFSYDA